MSFAAFQVTAPEVIEAETLTYVGCSNTYQSVWGYNTSHGTSERRVWVLNPGGNQTVAPYETGGGSLAAWDHNDHGHHEIFETHWEAGFPIWIQWCIRGNWQAGSGETNSFATAQSQVDAVLTWLDGLGALSVPIWCSSINTWTNDPPQVITAAEHEQVRVYTRDQINAAGGHALDGPLLGPLTPDLVQGDETHPNADGRAFLGGQLFDFFDPLVEVPS